MKSRHCFALFASALLPLASFAEPAKAPTDAPADARAPVPAPAYLSVLSKYQPAAEQAQSPDQLWRAANKEVEGGGMGHMGHTDATMPAAAETAKPDAKAGPDAMPKSHQHQHHDHHAQPQPQPQPTVADPHQGHQMHHQHKGH